MSRLFFDIVSKPLALEEESAGVSQREVEHTLYGKITNPQQLDGVAWEDHEQWELKIPKAASALCEGVIRIRKTSTPEKSECVLTIKTKADKAEGRVETSMLTTEDQLRQFKQLAEKGMLKRRYTFPIEGSAKKWEIDVYPKEGGGWHEWCKIDLEVKSLSDPLPPLPIELAELISKPYGQRSEAEEARVRGLYDSVFTMSRQTIAAIQAAS